MPFEDGVLPEPGSTVIFSSRLKSTMIDQLKVIKVHGGRLKRFPAKWKPVRVKKTRQNKNLEPRSDSIGTEMALVWRATRHVAIK
jgi:hypothetical protein